jgi:hypothetical protein
MSPVEEQLEAMHERAAFASEAFAPAHGGPASGGGVPPSALLGSSGGVSSVVGGSVE